MRTLTTPFGRTLLSSSRSPHQRRVDKMITRIREIGNMPPISTKPTIPPGRMIHAQARLILEEVMELFDAAGLDLSLSENYVETGLKRPFHRGDLELKSRHDYYPIELPDLAKEIADVSVVTTGMFTEFGIDDEEVLAAVDENNLAKFDPLNEGYLDENRKWRKPPNHPKPDIRSILIEQGWEPEKSNECTRAPV